MRREHLDVFLGTWTGVAELIDVELVRSGRLLDIYRYACHGAGQESQLEHGGVLFRRAEFRAVC